MRHWQPDRSTMRGPCYPPDSPFSHSDLGKCVKFHPAHIPRPAIYGDSWLHLAAAGDRVRTKERSI